VLLSGVMPIRAVAQILCLQRAALTQRVPDQASQLYRLSRAIICLMVRTSRWHGRNFLAVTVIFT